VSTTASEPSRGTAFIEERPLRRDAAENRARILLAAGRVFDARGLDAGVEEIAREASVGMGTLYRRFPTKNALIEALVRDLLEAIIAIADDAAAQPKGAGLEHFLEAACDYWANNPGCLARLWHDTDSGLVQTARRRIADLLKDAKDGGRVRADLTNTDLNVIMWSLRGVIQSTRSEAPDAWRRHLELLTAGMRPTVDTLLNPALTQQQLDTILSQR
jgi:AcrR family transcriptional regulator